MSFENIQKRRSGDLSEYDEIGELIKQENDPKTRAILMVLQSINLSLIANTQAVNDTDAQLKAHMIEFRTRTAEGDALVNRGRGMWRVISSIFVMAQAFLVWLMLQSLDELKGLHKADQDLSVRITILEQKK